MGSKHLPVRELVLYALLGALMYAGKMALAFLPNIEPVSFLVIVYTLTLGRKALWPMYLYVALEWVTWGFSAWSINYLYVWLILYWLTCLCRSMTSPLHWAVLSGGFGLFFGLLCAPVYAFIGGWGYAVSWWISGIPYDLLHCIGNFSITLVLFKPCLKILHQLYVPFHQDKTASH